MYRTVEATLEITKLEGRMDEILIDDPKQKQTAYHKKTLDAIVWFKVSAKRPIFIVSPYQILG